MKPREPYFDNLKCILIYLVTAGHFLLPLLHQPLLNKVFLYIYAFHMPCFIFVSGYFAKSVCQDGRFRFDKVATVLWLYLLFKLLVYPTENLAAGGPWARFDLFTESGAPWYLLALSLWYLTLPAAARIKPWLMISVSVIIGLLSGYAGSIHYFLSLSRALTFAPFFYAGYYIQKSTVQRLLAPGSRIFALALFIPASALVLKGAAGFLGQYSSVVYGIPYSYLGQAAARGGLVRLLWYLLAAVLMLGCMALVPNRTGIFTRIGANTLQIYILHRPIRDLCQYYGVFNRPELSGPKGLAIILAGSAALVLFLGNPLFTVLFNFISGLPARVLKRG